MTPRLGYCNSLLYGTKGYSLSQLQRCQNNAARNMSSSWKYNANTEIATLAVRCENQLKIQLLTNTTEYDKVHHCGHYCRHTNPEQTSTHGTLIPPGTFRQASLAIDLLHKFPNVPVPYPAMLHSEQKCVHFCSEWSIVGYGTGAFWDLWNWSIKRHLRPTSQSHNAPVPYPTMCHSEQRCVHLCVLWDMRQVHCGICEFGIRKVNSTSTILR